MYVFMYYLIFINVNNINLFPYFSSSSCIYHYYFVICITLIVLRVKRFLKFK